MDPDAVFNRYDIRGDHPDEVDADFAERLGRAAGVYARKETMRNTIVVGRDTRESSGDVYEPFVQGVRSTGVNVVDTGVSTTDRVAVAAGHYGGIGVMVTASHHAWTRTGFKFLYEAGNGFVNEDLDRLEELFRADESPADVERGAKLSVQHEFDETYIDHALDVFGEFADGIDATVVVDAVAGAERTAPVLFEELGADVVEHDWKGLPAPEPGRENRDAVRAAMADHDADIAVGYDPDADRVYAFHPETGWIPGDKLFYVLARIVEPERIVASIDTAPFIGEVAETSYTRVGDVFVADAGIDADADFLGEPNGHYAVPAFSWYNSGIFCSLLLAAHHDDVPGMLDEVADWTTERRVAVYEDTEERDAAMRDVVKRAAEEYAVESTVDGVKFVTDGCTALARPSGTSPKIRLIVHGTEDVATVAQDIHDTLFA